MLFYGGVLYTSGKISGIFLPQGDLFPLEIVAIAMNALAIFVFWYFRNYVTGTADPNKKLSGYIICWALNEAIVLFGFIAVYLPDLGNGFFYATNLIVALTSNLLTFPRK